MIKKPLNLQAQLEEEKMEVKIKDMLKQLKDGWTWFPFYSWSKFVTLKSPPDETGSRTIYHIPIEIIVLISELKANLATQTDKFTFHYCGPHFGIKTFPAAECDICKNSLVQMDFNPLEELRILLSKVDRLKKTVTDLSRTNVDLTGTLEISRRQIVEFRNLEAELRIHKETLKELNNLINADKELHGLDCVLILDSMLKKKNKEVDRLVASYGEYHDVIMTLSDQNSKMQEILESLVSGRHNETCRNIDRIKNKARNLLDEIKRSKAKANPATEGDSEGESNG